MTNKTPFDADAYISACTDAEQAAIGGLILVSKGMAKVDVAPAIDNETGEEVLAIIIRAAGQLVPIGHVCKDVGVDRYKPIIPKELKDVA